MSTLASLVAQTVKHLSTMRETPVQSLGWEDPLEKEMAIYSSTIAWKIPWTEEPGRLQSMGSQRVRHDSAISLSFSLTFSLKPGEINRFLVQQLTDNVGKAAVNVIACIWDIFATPTDTTKFLGAGTMSVHIFFFFVFIYLAAQGLSCGTQDFQSLSWHEDL